RHLHRVVDVGERQLRRLRMPPRGLVVTAALYEEVEMNETSHRSSGGNLRSNHALCNARHDRRRITMEDRLSRLCPDLSLRQRLSRPVYAERTAVRAAHDPFGPVEPHRRLDCPRPEGVAVDINRGGPA